MVNLPAVTIDRLRVVRGGNEVISTLTTHIPAGWIMGLLGPNGCGKTTLIRSIMRVQTIESGSVTVLTPRSTPT